MTLTVVVALVVVVLALGLFVSRAIPAVRAFFTFRGKRLITCPESHTKEAVEVAGGRGRRGGISQ